MISYHKELVTTNIRTFLLRVNYMHTPTLYTNSPLEQKYIILIWHFSYRYDISHIDTRNLLKLLVIFDMFVHRSPLSVTSRGSHYGICYMYNHDVLFTHIHTIISFRSMTLDQIYRRYSSKIMRFRFEWHNWSNNNDIGILTFFIASNTHNSQVLLVSTCRCIRIGEYIAHLYGMSHIDMRMLSIFWS
jgi:hypothetical protein